MLLTRDIPFPFVVGEVRVLVLMELLLDLKKIRIKIHSIKSVCALMTNIRFYA